MMEVDGQFEPLADFIPGAVTPGQCLIELLVGRTPVYKWLCVNTQPPFDEWNQISNLGHESIENVTELPRYNRSK